MTAEPRSTIHDPDVADYLDECGFAATTLTVCRHNLARWERWCGAHDVAVWAATWRHLRDYLAEREAAGVGGATRHKDWQHIRGLYAWAALPLDEGGPALLAVDPMLRVRPPVVEQPEVRSASPGDAAALVDHYVRRGRQGRRDSPTAIQAQRDAAIVAVLTRGGLRSAEVCGIDVADLVRDDAGTIVGAEVPAGYAKSRRMRLVPLTHEAPRLVERYLRRRGVAPGPLFLGRDTSAVGVDRRMTPRSVQGVIRRAGKACGIAVSAHDLRRGWAVASAEAGVERGWIKLAGGWAKDTTLDRYLGPSAQRLALEQFQVAAGARRPALRAIDGGRRGVSATG